jgi:flagellar motility protein MotE (MotC chaperone)
MQKKVTTVAQKIRLLPLVIVVATVALMVKMKETAHDLGFFVASAVAEEKPAEPLHNAKQSETAVDKKSSENHAVEKKIDAKPQEKSAGGKHDNAALPDPLAEGNTAKKEPHKDNYDVTEFSESELGLLQSLRLRREELAKKEAVFQQKERVLEGMDQRLQMKINELNDIKIALENIKQEIDVKSEKFKKNEDAQIKELVRVYEKMKPKEAAQIFNNLNLTILLDVVKGMQESKLALVLAAMDPKKATDVTTALGKREELPAMSSTATTQ